jgi:DNA-binding NarL/FixJ family response regulator
MILLCSVDRQVREHWLNGLAEARMAAEPVADVEQLHRRLNGTRDQMVILHLDMPGVEAVGLVSDLLRQHPTTRIYSMTARPEPMQGVALARAGVRGYGNCWMHPVTLSQSASLIQSGELWLGQEVIQHLIRGVAEGGAAAAIPNPATVQRLADLTTREHEIARRIAGGENNKQIGNELGITERTVKAHLGNIFQKTGTKNRLQLALLASGHVD